MLVLTLSTGLGVSCLLILIIIRLCKMYWETPRHTSSHVDLNRAMQHYEINTELHTLLPEQKVMQM